MLASKTTLNNFLDTFQSAAPWPGFCYMIITKIDFNTGTKWNGHQERARHLSLTLFQKSSLSLMILLICLFWICRNISSMYELPILSMRITHWIILLWSLIKAFLNQCITLLLICKVQNYVITYELPLLYQSTRFFFSSALISSSEKSGRH